jgi:hypothetical protein
MQLANFAMLISTLFMGNNLTLSLGILSPHHFLSLSDSASHVFLVAIDQDDSSEEEPPIVPTPLHS